MSSQAGSEKGLIKKMAEAIFGLEARLAAKWAESAHKRLMYSQWCIQPSPEWFDHQIDVYYLLQKNRNSIWCERGVFGGLALKGGSLLELSCGDGFNAKNFYSLRSKKVVACDFDPQAIATAKKKNKADNVEFALADIRHQMPDGIFENIVWDAAIEHFTPEEIFTIMKSIKSRLTSDGILSGYTIVEKSNGEKQLHQHEYEFSGKADLARFLEPYFKNIKIFETIHPVRHNLYFWASDSTLPFDDKWEYSLHVKS